MNAKNLFDIVHRINKEGLEGDDPCCETCIELLKDLRKNATKTAAVKALMQEEEGDNLKNFEKMLNRASRSFKRHKRSSGKTSTNHDGSSWENAIELCTNIIADINKMKENIQKEEEKKMKDAVAAASTPDNDGSGSVCFPSSVTEYRNRLVTHKKNLYKDPPVLPPMNIFIEPNKCGLPKRDNKTGFLTFVAGDDDSIKTLLKDFLPNSTPDGVLSTGSFGGTYFRPIISAVTNISYKSDDVLRDTLPKAWIEGLPKKTYLTSKTYQTNINKYGVKCGGCLGMWESSGWIVDSDPYGWFQWYCRFYQGRRCSDDSRQISRWLKSGTYSMLRLHLLFRHADILLTNCFVCSWTERPIPFSTM